MTQVQGLAALKRRWSRVPVQVRAAVIAQMEKSADEIVGEMRRLVPVESGTALLSIGWTWGDPPKGALVIGQVGERDAKALRITIYAAGDEAYYARFLEFGTQKMAARPFFYPVWRARRRRTRSRITRAINTAIKRS